MRLHRTWTIQSFQFQRSTDLPILAQRAPNRPLLQLADHLLHPADHTLHGPNRPLLQLADHLLHPADHTLHLFQQTIVTAGRPLVRAKLPQRLFNSSKVNLWGVHRNRKTVMIKSLSSDLLSDQSQRSYGQKTSNSPFAHA